MLTIQNVPCGLNFKDWQDVYHYVPDGSTIGSHLRDGLPEEEERYLDLEAITRGVNVHLGGSQKIWDVPQSKMISQARGVGNWQEPAVAIVCYEIDAMCGDASPLWDGIRVYHRLRPYSTNEKSRKYITKLIEHTGLRLPSFYLTSAVKNWMTSEQGIDLLNQELKFVRPKKIICMGHNTAEHLKRYTPFETMTLGRPEFWTKWHAQAWREHRERFKRLANS